MTEGRLEILSLHPEIAIHSRGEIGWAIRKNSPKLAAEINDFVKTVKKGTLLGNIVYKKYLKNNKWARNALDKESQGRYQEVSDMFKKYSDMYDFEFLMTVALAYQESQLDHNQKSSVGAVGIMQLLPSTAADKTLEFLKLRSWKTIFMQVINISGLCKIGIFHHQRSAHWISIY